MKLISTMTACIAMTAMAFGTAQAQVTNGETVPSFSVTTTDGTVLNNGSLNGKTVVLEWTNNECPFVKKHYGTNNMQDTQKTATDNGAVWVSVVSSAKGKQGHIDAAKAAMLTAERGAHPTHIVLDEDGSLGALFEAKTTPHMFVIKDGIVKYQGAIDDNSSHRPDTVAGAKNYVLAALDDLAAGKDVTKAQTKPYGCSVKY